MKTSSLSRIALVALALAAGSPMAFAQTTPASTAPSSKAPAHQPHGEAILTADERAHFEKVRTEALAANPSLKTQADNLKTQHKALKSQGASASAESRQALKALNKQYKQSLQTAMLKIDPTVGPLFDKMKGAHKNKAA